VETQRAVIFLQFFSSLELSKSPVKGTQRKVASFPGYFEDQTIGEPQRRTAPVVLQRGGDRTGILDCEISVTQEHLDGGRYFRVSEFEEDLSAEQFSLTTGEIQRIEMIAL
jgi:hypothetical protein